MPRKYKDIPLLMITAIENKVKLLLHASRDCLRTKGVDTSSITYIGTQGYYAEAFGVMQGLKLGGYGYMEYGPHSHFGRQPEHDLREWFDRLAKEVLAEENFRGSNECDFCLKKWGKDGAGRVRQHG